MLQIMRIIMKCSKQHVALAMCFFVVDFCSDLVHIADLNCPENHIAID